jgi:hypothetical protein
LHRPAKRAAANAVSYARRFRCRRSGPAFTGLCIPVLVFPYTGLGWGRFVHFPRNLTLSLLLACGLLAAGKDKKKTTLPTQVLQAETVLVLIDPQAGLAPDAPFANQRARDDVERALMNWGRFRFASDVSTADLIITVRKGNGRVAQGTIGGLPANNRPVIFEPTNSGGRGGVSQGTPPSAGDPGAAQPATPSPQVEIGSPDDTFTVYYGKRDNALDAPAVWRYTAEDALRSPGVPAVDAFEKAITEAEKQQTAKP